MRQTFKNRRNYMVSHAKKVISFLNDEKEIKQPTNVNDSSSNGKSCGWCDINGFSYIHYDNFLGFDEWVFTIDTINNPKLWVYKKPFKIDPNAPEHYIDLGDYVGQF